MATVTEQIAGRLDTKTVHDNLGAAYQRFEVAVVSTVIRIKGANRTLPIAAVVSPCAADNGWPRPIQGPSE